MTPAEVDKLVDEVARLRLWIRAAELEADALAIANSDLRSEILTLRQQVAGVRVSGHGTILPSGPGRS